MAVEGLTTFLCADHHPPPSSLLSGDVSSAVALLEDVYTRPDGAASSMSFVFRKLLEDGNEEALDKCKTKLSLWGLYTHLRSLSRLLSPTLESVHAAIQMLEARHSWLVLVEEE